MGQNSIGVCKDQQEELSCAMRMLGKDCEQETAWAGLVCEKKDRETVIGGLFISQCPCAKCYALQKGSGPCPQGTSSLPGGDKHQSSNCSNV